MTFWAAVHTDSQAEHIARREIEAQGFGTFLPHFRVGTWRGSQLRFHERALFPRYLFVQMPDHVAWGDVAGANGVSRVLVTGDGQPARVPPEDIAALMVAHASGVHDVVVPRNGAGRFRRHRRRRRRPRHGKVTTGSPPT